MTQEDLYSIISKECKRSHERKTSMINTIDISGKWELFISEKELSSIPTDYSDSITLPDTLSNDTSQTNTPLQAMRGSGVRLRLRTI